MMLMLALSDVHRFGHGPGCDMDALKAFVIESMMWDPKQVRMYMHVCVTVVSNTCLWWTCAWHIARVDTCNVEHRWSVVYVVVC